jgi:hypothetical protein
MSEQRTYRQQSVSQRTGNYNNDAILLDDFGALLVDTELYESEGGDLTYDQVYNLSVGESVRYGGGAGPLIELTRIS